MPWQLDGTFVRENPDFQGATVWSQDQQASIKVIASRHDYHDEDLAVGIQSCLNLDGLNAMREDLNMGGNGIINLVAGSQSGDLATFDQLIDSGTFDNGTRDLTLHTPLGDLPDINIPAGDTSSTEGQWTPSLVSALMGGDNGGYWIRDGRLVTIFGYVEWTSHGGGSTTVTLTGMPYNISPAYPTAPLQMYSTTWLTGEGMDISGVGLAYNVAQYTSGGTLIGILGVNMPEAVVQGIRPKSSTQLELVSYFGRNNTDPAVTDVIVPYELQFLAQQGRFGFQMQYMTDDP